jgi:chemotaxis protein histidine kinase CheA
MMALQDELLEDFVQEMKTIRGELKALVDTLMKMPENKMDKALFEKYGQAVDRIYGTATTLGYLTFGKYMKSMKDMCYLCSHHDNPTGHKKILRMMMECVEKLDAIIVAIPNKVEFKKMDRLFLVEITKAERLENTDFRGVVKKPVGSK